MALGAFGWFFVGFGIATLIGFISVGFSWFLSRYTKNPGGTIPLFDEFTGASINFYPFSVQRSSQQGFYTVAVPRMGGLLQAKKVSIKGAVHLHPNAENPTVAFYPADVHIRRVTGRAAAQDEELFEAQLAKEHLSLENAGLEADGRQAVNEKIMDFVSSVVKLKEFPQKGGGTYGQNKYR